MANNNADILSGLQELNASIQELSSNLSQSALKDLLSERRNENNNKDSTSDFFRRRKKKQGFDFNNIDDFLDDFSEEFESAILENLFGSDFKNSMKSIGQNIADQLGTSVKDLPKEVNKRLGKYVGSKVGLDLTSKDQEWMRKGYSSLERGLESFVSNLKGGKGFRTSFSEANQSLGRTLTGSNIESARGIISRFKGSYGIDRFLGKNVLTSGMSGLKSAFGGVISNVKAFGPAIKGLGSAIIKTNLPLLLFQKGLELVSAGLTALFELIAAYSKAANRDQESRQKNLEYANKRFKDDVNTLISEPFRILKEAAQNVYDAWDRSIRLINQTQGYDKAGLQDLMSSFAQRLQSEGLEAVIPGTDIISMLENVLKSGLSGKVAEEFAYQVTKLNAAIPTQDFSSVAATYSSVAANAIALGKSQSEAISEANKSLEQFAGNLLYASRELAGGFSTGLTNAQSLYEQSVKIAQAARSQNVNQISGVLTSVSAIVGAMAPDLASGLVDTVVKAATGGNSSDIVALRSLANINASNTEFLRAFARDPQKIFSEVFRNLGNMFAQSSDAYMEKAQGYAELFGISSEAFQRVDFNRLADAISNMNTSNASLEENVKLLRSGQSTTSAEQLKMQQINKYMIEEGLSYVVDSAAGRMIQEHMWEEQLNRELMEATYGVELVGKTSETLQKLGQTVVNILNFFNPFSWFKKIAQAITTEQEAKANESDIKTFLELSKVGAGGQRSLFNLTNRNLDLNLTPGIIELMGGRSAYQSNRALTKALATSDLLSGLLDVRQNAFGLAQSIMPNGTQLASSPSSMYSWRISKSAASNAQSGLHSIIGSIVYSALSATKSATEMAASQVRDRIKTMLSDEYISEYIGKEGGGYEAWKASASSQGISDFSKAAQSAGYNESEIEQYFQDKETEAGLKEQHSRDEMEYTFYQHADEFVETRFWEEYQTPLSQSLDQMYVKQTEYTELFRLYKDEDFKMYSEAFTNYSVSFEDHKTNVKTFQDQWMEEFSNYRKELQGWWKDYKTRYIDYNIYSGGSLKLNTLQKVQNDERSEKGDVVNALAEYLTKNTWNLEDFKDPQIQANALLAQILVVVNAIMNQNNEKVGSVSLIDSLNAMATGSTLVSTTR